MKKFAKFSLFGLIAALAFTACLPIFARKTAPIEADAAVSSKLTGYKDASNVKYVTTSSGIVANWGARDEDCVFLTTYAQSFYTGSYTYEALSNTSGGTSQSTAPSSALYKSLKSLMTDAHTFYTYYDGSQNARDYYKYAVFPRLEFSFGFAGRKCIKSPICLLLESLLFGQTCS